MAADCIDTFNLLGSVPIQLQAHQTRVTLSHSSCMYTTAPVDVGKHGCHLYYVPALVIASSTLKANVLMITAGLVVAAH